MLSSSTCDECTDHPPLEFIKNDTELKCPKCGREYLVSHTTLNPLRHTCTTCKSVLNSAPDLAWKFLDDALYPVICPRCGQYDMRNPHWSGNAETVAKIHADGRKRHKAGSRLSLIFAILIVLSVIMGLYMDHRGSATSVSVGKQQQAIIRKADRTPNLTSFDVGDNGSANFGLFIVTDHFHTDGTHTTTFSNNASGVSIGNRQSADDTGKPQQAGKNDLFIIEYKHHTYHLLVLYRGMKGDIYQLTEGS